MSSSVAACGPVCTKPIDPVASTGELLPGAPKLPGLLGDDIRPFAEGEGRRFAARGEIESVSPQLRVRRMLAAAASGRLDGNTSPAPGTIADLTLTPGQLLEILATIDVDDGDRHSLLAQNVVPIHTSDLDGTLWMAPIADALVYDELAGSGRLKPCIREKLDEVMAEMDLEPSGLDEPDRGVNRDVLRVKAAFDEGKKSYSREELIHFSRLVYPVTSWALAGFSTEEVRAMTREVIAKHDLGDLAFAGARAHIDALAACGIPTVLFSASNDVLAQEAVDVVFGTEPRLHVVGTHVDIDDDGIMTTALEEGPCFREVKLAKVRRYLRQWVTEHHPELSGRIDLEALRPLLASGDSPSKTDEQMMDEAVIACTVEPATDRDAQHALTQARQTGRSFILDYLRIRGGGSADTFRGE